jgi:DNA-binding HxlR family transcriptional regulator
VRAHLKGLEGAGIAAMQPREGSPGVVEWALTDEGRDLLAVHAALARWLKAAPSGPMELGGDAGKMAVTALLGGWSSTILCFLAAGPLSLTELAECIKEVSYPSLERRLSAMRLTGQLQACPSDGNKGTPYEITEWLRQGTTLLAAAVRWEYEHRSETVPLSRTDTEAALLLALPMLHLGLDLNGTCGLGVQIDDEDGSHCGASASVKKGKVVDCSPELEDDVDALATGTPPSWAHAMLEASTDRLELDGNKKLAAGLVDGLHGTLFGNGQRPSALH